MNAGIVIGANVAEVTAEVAEVTPEIAAPVMVQVTLSEAEYLAVQKAIHSALPKVSLPAVGRVARTVATAPFRALAFTGGLLVRGVVAAAVGSGIGQAARTGFGK